MLFELSRRVLDYKAVVSLKSCVNLSFDKLA